MGTILTGMVYTVTTHGAHATKETCILGKPNVNVRYNVIEEPADIFVNLATNYALAGPATLMNEEVHTLPMPRRYLLQCNRTKGLARGIFIESYQTSSTTDGQLFADVEPALSVYKIDYNITLRASALIGVFSSNTGLVRLLLNSLDPNDLHYTP